MFWCCFSRKNKSVSQSLAAVTLSIHLRESPFDIRLLDFVSWPECRFDAPDWVQENAVDMPFVGAASAILGHSCPLPERKNSFVRAAEIYGRQTGVIVKGEDPLVPAVQFDLQQLPGNIRLSPEHSQYHVRLTAAG